MKFAFVFPGQGSQSLGMMQAYGDMPVVRTTFQEASDALGQDLWQLVTSGPEEDLSLTVNTQPLMLTAGVAVYRAWCERGGALPAAMAGHSLGEYSALVAAGSINFSDAVALVRKRAQVMQEAVPKGEGAMAAILGLEDDQVRAACAQAAQGQVVEAVNFNAAGQVIVAGHAAAVERAMEAAKALGAKRALALPVSGPFHSSLMRPAAEAMLGHLAALQILPPSIPVLHNADVAAYAEPEKIRDALYRQIYTPVRWVETLHAFAGMGLTHAWECGPGKVLAGLTKRGSDGLLIGGALSDAASFEASISVLSGGEA